MGISRRWIFILTTIFSLMRHTAQGKVTCREIQFPRDCEVLCSTNQTGVISCELRVAVILPADPNFEISLPKVLPVLDLAVYDARARNLLPYWLNLKFLPQDDHCDAMYAQVCSIDSYLNCVHLFLGPACDYCVAVVGRAVKFLGAPLITTGGFTFDFTQQKKECKDEYFMTTRVGNLAFRDIAQFLIAVINYYEWRKVHLFYATNGQIQVGGRHSCQLMMKSMVEYLKKEPNFTFGTYDIETATSVDYSEALKTHVGTSYGGCENIGAYGYSHGMIDEVIINILKIGTVVSQFYVGSGVGVDVDVVFVGVSVDVDVGDRDGSCGGNSGSSGGGGGGGGDGGGGGCWRWSDLVDFEGRFRSPWYLSPSSALNAFLGPVCDYVIAPVARYAGVWGIPVLTAGAQAEAFRHKDEHYPTLTRMMGSHRLVGEALRHILQRFGWKIAGLLYHNHAMASSRGNSECHFTLGAVFTALNQTPAHRSFNQETTNAEDYRNLLLFVSKSARIVVMCANSTTIREILLAAEELGMVDSGEYVFFSIELSSRNPRPQLLVWIIGKPRSRNIVANYYGANKTLEYISGKKIHWSGGKEKPPLDTPTCGFDKSLCPDNSLPGYAILSMVLSSIVVVLVVGSVFIYRHFKLEAEIASMTWKVHWDDIMWVPYARTRGSMYSLIANKLRNSQLDILENEQIKLDRLFRVSLIHDIVRGMAYLHASEVKSHGNLKSSNCVVDSRFGLKIADFGLHELRRSGLMEEEFDKTSYAYWRRQLWTAPELLRMERRPPEGTQKGDVYSFGIIVHEIVIRKGPFYLGENYDPSPNDRNSNTKHSETDRIEHNLKIIAFLIKILLDV
ncbi:hypothetical protein HZH68_014639 [Vespula germanica]|uniref:Protein kinase domain-containing protein n=1 Tax=Vespula germanica TaxID=30212 RepID=A0A834MSP7_VESGE|nr:hypothetical protein HZH68_014639 [Vespula germanica]